MQVDLKAVAERAAAAIATLHARGRVAYRWPDGVLVWWQDDDGLQELRISGFVPAHDLHLNLSDHLTVMALLLIVREASGDPFAYTRVIRHRQLWDVTWVDKDGIEDVAWLATTEAEVLVNALEKLAAEPSP